MTAYLHHPLLIEIPQDNDMMELAMENLSYLGFMARYGWTPIYPYAGFKEAFYQENDTYPTHFLLTDASFDPVTDGLSVELCGQVEVQQAPKTLLDEDIREIDWDTFCQKVDRWLQY